MNASQITKNQKLIEAIVQEQFDKINNTDHLVKDDPKQCQQMYIIEIQKVTVVLEGFNNHKLQTRCVNKNEDDVLIYSPKEPIQHHLPNRVNPDRFMFFIEASNFYFMFSFREFDIDMEFKLRSFQITDRTHSLEHLTP